MEREFDQEARENAWLNQLSQDFDDCVIPKSELQAEGCALGCSFIIVIAILALAFLVYATIIQ